MQKDQTKKITTKTPSHLHNPVDELISKALDKDLDLTKLAQLYDLKLKYEKDEARKAYCRALSAFLAETPIIKATRQGYTGNKYPGLAESLQTIKPIMSKHGLHPSWRTFQHDGQVGVTCVIMHVNGHDESTSLIAYPDTSGKKNPIQAIGSTVEYLRRYTMFSLLGLASSADDLDGGMPNVEIITTDQAQKLYELLQTSDMAIFKTWLKSSVGVSEIEQIPASHYIHVKSKVEESLKQKTKSRRGNK